MMRFARALLAALVAVSLSAGVALAQDPAPASSQDEIVLAQAKKRSSRARNTGTHVYLLRGFMDIFSTGMDDLGVKLNRRGIRASVHGHAEYQSLADAIGARHRQGIRENVVIIGHSLGANAAFQMAERLGEHNITVPLIISYDPTATMTVSGNVRRVVNFYSSTNGWGAPIARGPGFRGNLANIDLSRRGEMGHTDIDKSPALHSQSIGYIQSIGGSRRATSNIAAPKRDAKEEESSTKPAAKAKDTPNDATASISEETSSPAPSAEAKPAPGNESSAKAGDAKSESKSTEVQSADIKSPETKSSDSKSAGEKTETAASPATASSTNN